MPLAERALRGSLAVELAAPPDVTLRVRWPGQAGFAIDGDGWRVVIDPYLSDSLAEKHRGARFPHVRLMSSPVDAGAIRQVDAVLATHAHGDHLDPGTLPSLLGANPRAVLVAPEAARADALSRAGIDEGRFRGLDAGEEVELGPDLSVRATRAAHEAFGRDAAGRHRFLDFLLRIGGAALFPSGDTVPFEGQPEELRALDADLALLPANGDDAERRTNGVPGNMDLAEAAALCRAAGIPAAVLHHFDLFAFNTVPRAEVEAVARRARDVYLVPARAGCA